MEIWKNWNRICFVCHVLKNLFVHVFVAVIINAICFVEIYICNRWWWMKLLMTKLNQLAIISLFWFVNKFNFVTNAQKLIMFQFSLHRKSWWNPFESIQFHCCSILQLSHHCVCAWMVNRVNEKSVNWKFRGRNSRWWWCWSICCIIFKKMFR